MQISIMDNAELLARIADLEHQIKERDETIANLQKLAFSDPLTGAFNRRRMEEILLGELSRYSRHEHEDMKPVSVVLMDIDFFKKFNDKYGHDVGDQVLRTLVNAIKAHSRPYDVLSRFGGEEFLLILPGTFSFEAFGVMERLRTAIAGELNIRLGDTDVQVDFSAGVATCLPADTIETLIKRADNALYRAKEAGRGRTCLNHNGAMLFAGEVAEWKRTHVEELVGNSKSAIRRLGAKLIGCARSKPIRPERLNRV